MTEDIVAIILASANDPGIEFGNKLNCHGVSPFLAMTLSNSLALGIRENT
jgi:hypothetical protein